MFIFYSKSFRLFIKLFFSSLCTREYEFSKTSYLFTYVTNLFILFISLIIFSFSESSPESLKYLISLGTFTDFRINGSL